MALETEDGIVIVTTCEDGAFAVASGEVSTIVKGEFFGGEEELMLTTRSSKDLSDDHDSKRRRSTYSVSKKLEILHKYETLYKRNARKTERETGVPRKCIQRWLQQRDKIEELARSYYDAYGHELQGFTVRESRAVFPELEAELAGYVMQHQGVTRSEVSRLAINIFPTVYPSKDPSCFKASKHWFNNFMQRLKEGVDYVPKAKAREELEKATRNHPVCVSQDFRVPSACKGRALVAGVDPKLSIETIRNDVTGDAVLRSVLNITGGQGDQEEVEGDEGGPKKSRSTYSLPFKHNVIQKYYGEFGQSITKASKTLGIPRKCIHRWLQQRRKIEAQLELNHKSVEGKGAQPDKPCPENQVTTLSEETTFCTREDKIENPLLGSYQAPSLKTDTSHPIKLPTLVARKARSMYSVEYKRNTIEKYDRLYNGSIRRTARETGIPRKCVQRWVRQRRQIEELVSTEGGESMRRLRLFDPNKRTLPIHQKVVEADKEWVKLRKRNGRVKRELKEKMKSGTSTAAARRGQRKVEDLRFRSCLDSFIQPLQSRGTFGKPESSCTQLYSTSQDEGTIPLIDDDDEKESDLSDHDSTSSATSGNLQVLAGRKRKSDPGKQIFPKEAPKYVRKQEETDLAILESIGIAARAMSKRGSRSQVPRDEIIIFGELITEKLRKLAMILTPDEVDDVQENLLDVLKNAKNPLKNKP